MEGHQLGKDEANDPGRHRKRMIESDGQLQKHNQNHNGGSDHQAPLLPTDGQVDPVQVDQEIEIQDQVGVAIGEEEALDWNVESEEGKVVENGAGGNFEFDGQIDEVFEHEEGHEGEGKPEVLTLVIPQQAGQQEAGERPEQNKVLGNDDRGLIEDSLCRFESIENVVVDAGDVENGQRVPNSNEDDDGDDQDCELHFEVRLFAEELGEFFLEGPFLLLVFCSVHYK